MNRKAEMFALITELHARGFTRSFIGAAIDRSPQRVGQIIRLLRLEPPQFATLADGFTWLAREVPDLELRCRYFRFQGESHNAPKALKVA